MIRFASTAGEAASFDFFTNVITLKALPAAQFWRVEQFMRNRNVFAAGGQLAQQARVDKAILVHEVTHFIDATTSLWGLEYNARKTLATQLLTQGQAKNKEYQKMMQVFMLNTAEIDAHKRYTRQHQPAVSLCKCIMHHRVNIIEGYGPMVIIEYHLNGSVIIEVPLSMLSLLEAHAYANETLSMIFDAEALNKVAERSKIMSEIEKNYIASLNYQGAVEYTMLLQLIERGFPELDLKHRLCFFAAIARIALDADAAQMSTFAQHIAPTFSPSSAAESTILDMLRGLSRAVFAFKSILALNGMLSQLAPLSHAQVVTDVKADALQRSEGC